MSRPQFKGKHGEWIVAAWPSHIDEPENKLRYYADSMRECRCIDAFMDNGIYTPIGVTYTKFDDEEDDE